MKGWARVIFKLARLMLLVEASVMLYPSAQSTPGVCIGILCLLVSEEMLRHNMRMDFRTWLADLRARLPKADDDRDGWNRFSRMAEAIEKKSTN